MAQGGHSLRCPACSTENPTENQFCGNCGGSLVSTDPAIGRQVDQILKDRLKDRVVVEYDLTEKLTARFGMYLRIAGWVFAPSLFILCCALALIAALGLKTFSDAQSTIRNAAQVAVQEVQGKATNAKTTIETALAEAQKTIAAYEKTITKLSAKMTDANALVASVTQNARENQQKLASLAAARESNPNTTLGQISPSLFAPSPDYNLRLSSPGQTFQFSEHSFKKGQSGEDVELLQRRLQDRECYNGKITGVFDDDTSVAVNRYLSAIKSFSFPPALAPPRCADGERLRDPGPFDLARPDLDVGPVPLQERINHQSAHLQRRLDPRMQLPSSKGVGR
jgi:hypothetical protein